MMFDWMMVPIIVNLKTNFVHLQNFDRKHDVYFQFFILQFRSELWIEQRRIKLYYAEEQPWQAVYQLKVGHDTNCVISRYHSRVLLSLKFCLFWEGNSKL